MTQNGNPGSNGASPESDSNIEEVLTATQDLLDCIFAGDWETYTRLCDPTLSAFEPESRGMLVQGLDFHRYYFELEGGSNPYNITMAAPHVRLIGEDMAIVCYVRLVQSTGSDGPSTSRCEETRVWVRRPEGWKHVHFHRSVGEG